MSIIISIFAIKALQSMKYTPNFFLFTCLFFSLSIQAQQNHFIYIQADSRQPFYVKLDKKIYSSSASGYLILSRLQTGEYNLAVGFPQNEWPEQILHCAVNDKDQGYLLKNFGDNGWGLFNLQTLAILMADSKGNKKADDVSNTKDVRDDAFSNMLSTVVNDPAIKQKDPIKEEVKKVILEPEMTLPLVVSQPVNEVVKKSGADDAKASVITVSVPAKEEIKKLNTDTVNTVAAVIAEPVKEAIKKEIPEPEKTVPVVVSEPVKEAIKKTESEPVNSILVSDIAKDKHTVATADEPEEKRGGIAKKFSSKTDSAIVMLYLDSLSGNKEPVSVIINIEKINTDSAVIKSIKEEKPAEIVKPAAIKESAMHKGKSVKKNVKGVEVSMPDQSNVINENKTDTLLQPAIAVIFIPNSDCKNFATEEDFLKIRKKMAAASNEEVMITMAKKMFKSKCFTTEQVKNLGTLFLKDAERYSFFDAAYPFVSDSQNFAILESQLTDGYYINRFKVMIKH